MKIIQRHVGYFNGWRVDESQEYLDCLDAAYDILAYLKRKKLMCPNAALCHAARMRPIIRELLLDRKRALDLAGEYLDRLQGISPNDELIPVTGSADSRPKCCLTEAGLECIGTTEKEACGWHGCEDAATEVPVSYTPGWNRLGWGYPERDENGEDTIWVCPKCGGECSHTPLDEIEYSEGAHCECRQNAELSGASRRATGSAIC